MISLFRAAAILTEYLVISLRTQSKSNSSNSAAAASAATSDLLMPPPSSKAYGPKKTARAKRANSDRPDVVGFRSVPTTPNQNRAFGVGDDDQCDDEIGGGGGLRLTESDSDSACGFDTNWKE